MKRQHKAIVSEVLIALAAAGGFLVLIFALRFPFWVGAGLGVLFYIALSLLTRPNRFRVGKIEAGDAETFKTLEAIVGDGYQKLDEIRRLRDAIRDPGVQAKVDRISASAGRIFSYLEKNPDRVKSAKRFFSYYLDTTCTILSKYAEISAQGAASDDIARTLAKAEGILGTIGEAFDKQLSSLMENDVMDLDAEISLLENTIRMEGF